ncbi:Ig-like domain-containing protein [Nocardioides sambongensis]|uniref:Ig-like domain-containing protein n=1 Tax=Nocardioides sambongensis TaxID=2589074 RepID=UPI00112A5A8B|nr:Ig-like domain-containing protein [Nocardioides sambongensis]
MRARIAAATLAVPLSLAALSPLSPLTGAASAAPDPVADGDGWTVATAPGGYEITLELDKPLPVVSDAPTLVVDGETVGIATESADGGSLTVFTADPSVARASSVEAGWTSEAVGPSTAAVTEEVLPAASAAEPLPADPTAPGDYDWTESIYKFGDQSVDLAAIGGIRGELEGKLYLPTTGGERPVVLLLHGRHSYCYGTGASNPNRWPCSSTQLSIPSYLGYDGTARALASHGYSVVSISANAINANDNQLAADQGAQARGQLILDTLDMLGDANAGRTVGYHDDATDADVSLAQALSSGTAALAERAAGFVEAPAALDTVVPADLVGRFDLDHVGMMGHSRGGEGVTSAAVLNTMREKPFGLETILPLAPVDFGRMTVPDVAMNVILPYCDGDVSNQQGQHMLDDSRYAFGDDVLRTGTWAMGANHNFYNTVWTPGVYQYSVSDDWSGSTARRTEPICGTDASVAATSIRMTPQEQYDQGSAYMTAWFRLTLGGEERFLPMFDGTGAVPESLGDEDIRTQATAPSSARTTIADFERTSSLIRPFGGATSTLCASLAGRAVPQVLPACASGAMASSTVPHWTPASNGGNVPATPVTQLSWTTSSGELRVAVPAAKRDVADADHLSVKMAAAESVSTATDLTLSVIDGAGVSWSGLVSETNPQALVRLPTSETSTGTTYLKKLVLQQVMVPTSTIAEAGVDLSDVREVRFTGVDTGAAYLSDLAFESSAVGTATVGAEPVLDVYAPYVDEGDAAGTYDLAVHLDGPATAPVTGYVSLLGSSSTGSRAGAAMEKVTFAPGETCKVVTAALQGDTTASSSSGTSLKASVTNTRGAVMGRSAIVFTTIREDDGVTVGTELPPYGVPGDVCAELASLDETGVVTASDETPLPGDTITLSAAGFRAGEGVTFTAAGIDPVTAVADGTGLAAAELTVPTDVTRGTVEVTATAAATGRSAEGRFAALDATSTALTWAPEAIEIGQPIELTATVSGAEGVEVDGPVEFFDGTESLGTAEAVDGVATLTVPSFRAGTHEVSAVFAATATSQSSTSNAVTFVLSRRQTTLSLSLSASATTYGTGAEGTVTVPDGSGAEVTVSVDGTEETLVLDDEDSATFTLPATLAVGEHTVTAEFAGTDELAPSGRLTAAYAVTKAPTALTVATKDAVKRGKKALVRTKVTGAVAGTPVTGTVKIQVAKGNGAFRTVATRSLNGTAVSARITAPTAKKVPYLRVRAVLGAGDTYTGATSTVVVVALR